jgi:probable HAF family extracellular repeat protein
MHPRAGHSARVTTCDAKNSENPVRQISFAILVALGCVAVAASASASHANTQHNPQPVHYRITVLPSLGGAVLNSRGKSINDFGVVAGYSNAPNGKRHAAAWAFGQKYDLGTLGLADDLASSVPWPVKNGVGLISGISLTDDVDPSGGQGWSCSAGGFLANPGGHTCHGFVWAWGHMRDLKPLPGGYNSFATGTNNWGQTAGWAENGIVDADCVAPQTRQFKPVIWGPGQDQIRTLPLIGTDTSGSVTAINDLGQAVGISGICDQAVGRSSAKHAVLWDHGHATHIVNPTGAEYWNTTMALSERGEVAGFGGKPGDFDGNFTQAFRWSRSGGWKWIDLLPGDIASIGTGINERGQVVGYSNDAAPAFHAWIWQNGQTSKLDDLIDRSNGFAGTLTLADDINDFGVITGRGTDVDGSRIAFIATPIAH